MGKLDGKTALIIGASSGLGRAIALGYAREGAAIIAASRTPEGLQAVATELQGLGAAVTTRPFDATEPEAFPRLDRWLDAEGRDFDVLVYTPGGGHKFYEEFGPIARSGPPDPTVLAPLFAKYDMALLGPPLRLDAEERVLQLSVAEGPQRGPAGSGRAPTPHHT